VVAPQVHLVSGVNAIAFRSLAVGATFRMAGNPAVLWCKVSETHAVVDRADLATAQRIPKKEAVWPAARLTRRWITPPVVGP
jgi:hypothetical protein